LSKLEKKRKERYTVISLKKSLYEVAVGDFPLRSYAFLQSCPYHIVHDS
jgi:hypothetical protein